MIEYADTAGCLRSTILEYFGDADAQNGCAGCDNCRPGALDAYERDLLRKVLSGIARAGERFGDRRIVAMLLGETAALPPALAALSTTGLLRHESEETLREWIGAAISAGFVVKSADRFRVLGLTPAGRDVMRGTATDIRIPPRASRGDKWLWRKHSRARNLLDDFDD